MSELNKKDLHTPFTGLTIKKILAHVNKSVSEQVTAANLVASPFPRMSPTVQDLTVYDVFAFSAVAPAAGESMTFDVLVDGVSILAAPISMDSTYTPKTQLKGVVLDAKKSIPKGSLVTSTRAYTAGGGALPLTNTSLTIEAFPT